MAIANHGQARSSTIVDASGLGGALRQLSIFFLLVGALITLVRFARADHAARDSDVLLATGFLVLASYTFGQFFSAIQLPHITGYLMAGVLLGPSFCQLLPASWQLPPFDRGVLNPDVQAQLKPVDTLAVALIAMTAGNELHLKRLRAGLWTYVSLVSGQLGACLVGIPALVVALRFMGPALGFHGLANIGLEQTLALGFVAASIAYATSPAATLAIIHDTKSEGDFSRTVLTTVVLKEFVVVLVHALAALYAGRLFMGSAGSDSLALELTRHVVVSLLAGMTVGVAVVAYFRLVRRQLLLFLVATVYASSLVAGRLDLDPFLLFIASGFWVRNFSRQGDRMAQAVEELSLPVYVAFFALAGASLHLNELLRVLPFALLLTVVRALLLAAGNFVGAYASGGSKAMRRTGGVAFLSQAGVALSLTSFLGVRYGEAGSALQTLFLASIAVNEALGPIALKIALTVVGDTQAARKRSGAAEDAKSVVDAEPDSAPRLQRASLWSSAVSSARPATPPGSASPELADAFAGFRQGLVRVLSVFQHRTIRPYEEVALQHLAELRRDVLRHLRRLSVMVRSDPSSGDWRQAVRRERAEFSERWRIIILRRAALAADKSLDPSGLVGDIELQIETLPRQLRVPYEPQSYRIAGAGNSTAVFFVLLRRLRRRLARWLGLPPPLRVVPLATVARETLTTVLPRQCEGVMALFVQAEKHMVARARELFEDTFEALGILAQESSPPPPADRLREQRNQALEALREMFDESSGLASEEVRAVARDLDARASEPIWEGFSAFCERALVAGTWVGPPLRVKRDGYRTAHAELRSLVDRMPALQDASAASLSLLALELEMAAYIARTDEALKEPLSRLLRDVRGRTLVQLERLEHEIEASAEVFRNMLGDQEAPPLAGDVADGLQTLRNRLEKVVGEVQQNLRGLQARLEEEHTLVSLVDAASKGARTLTENYRVSVGVLGRGEWRLPAPPDVVEVPFRDVVCAYVDTSLAPHTADALRKYAHFLRKQATMLGEFERAIAFNLELALSEVEIHADADVLGAETRSLLRDLSLTAFRRHHDTLDQHLVETERAYRELVERLRETTLGSLRRLRVEFAEGGISRGKVDAIRRNAASRRLLLQAERIPTRLSRLGQLIERHVRYRLGRDRLERLRRIWSRPEQGVRLQVRSDQGGDAGASTVSSMLPTAYRRLFSADRIEAADVLTGRQNEIERARQALELAPGARLRTVALLGADGVGKISLANAVVRSKSWKQVHRLQFERPLSIEEAVSLAESRFAENHLVLVEGLHWLLTSRGRSPLGLDALTAAMVEPRNRCAWLIHADPLVWRHACDRSTLEHLVREPIDLPPLDQRALQRAVLARHALSGLELVYDGLGLGRQSPGSQGSAQSRYFRVLHSASGGLLRDALRLWLASIRRIDERAERVVLGEVPDSPLFQLRRQSEARLLELFFVARQGWCGAADFAEAFGLSELDAKGRLARLEGETLLERHGAYAYRISPRFRGACSQVFLERKWWFRHAAETPPAWWQRALGRTVSRQELVVHGVPIVPTQHWQRRVVQSTLTSPYARAGVAPRLIVDGGQPNALRMQVGLISPRYRHDFARCLAARLDST